MNVLIISGGSSSEREVSLRSANAVKEALESKDHHVEIFDLKNGEEALRNKAQDFDILFPVMHGAEGEGGELQAFLKSLGKPFVGGDPDGFKEGFYKASFKRFCEKHQIPTAKWQIIHSEEEIEKFGFPCVLKNSEGGSSREVVILQSAEDLPNAQQLLSSEDELYVEQFLEGVEITVGVLREKPLPVIEIIPPEGKWFDYENKYSGETQEIPNAPSLTEEQRQQAQELAVKIHNLLKLGDISRTDMILKDKQLYVLEVNTIPGMTGQSLFPKAALAAGMSFAELCDLLVN